MRTQLQTILFVCTGNSARSILAEGLMGHLGRDRYTAFSAGSQPSGRVNPLAIKTLEQLRMPSKDFRSKSWSEFAQAGAPALDFVLTVCDNAAGEVCPVWPGQPISAHWGVPDPSQVEGTQAEREKAFLHTAMILKRRIDLMLALPIDKLAGLSLQKEIANIGKVMD